jgi:putative flippase GtrA
MSTPLSRSAIVGVAATLADLAMLMLLDRLGVSPAWANVPALTLGIVIQFVGNKLWAFRDRNNDARALARQGGTFLAIEAVAFVLNAALFHVLAVLVGVPALLARVLVSAAVYFGFSFPLWGRVFIADPTPPMSSSPSSLRSGGSRSLS